MIATISAIKRGWFFDAIAIAVELQQSRLGPKVVSNGTRDQKRGIFVSIGGQKLRPYNMYLALTRPCEKKVSRTESSTPKPSQRYSTMGLGIRNTLRKRCRDIS